MRKFFSRLLKFNGSSKKFLLIFALALFLGLFGLAQPAEAGLSGMIWKSFAWIGEVILNLEGRLLLWVINFLIIVSGYNNFLNAPVVSTGWKLVRDVANMFFILVMLVIAFGTMLNLEKYSWKKLLPKMIFMIFLINFSKTIIGLLIDFGQVIMLTFVNAFASVAGGNFIQMFQMESVMKLSKANLEAANYDADMQAMYGALGVFLGVIVMGVALIVVTVFAMILLFRILTLWILIITSPLIFLLGTFEKGREYYSEWWKELVNSIIVGPLVAFFLWLSLATMGQSNNIEQLKGDNNALKALASEDAQYYNQQEIAGTEIGQWENLGSFVVGVALLFAALQRIQKLGVAGAGLASGAANWMKKTAGTVAKKYAIPAALTAYTGGGIISAMGLREGTRAAIGAASGLPLVGGMFKALGKGADQYGLKTEKGAGGYVGRKAKGGLYQGQEYLLEKAAGKIPLIGTTARGKAAELKAERLGPARETEKKVNEYTDEGVMQAAKQKAFTSETQQEKFSAISRILSESELRKKVKPDDLQAMVADLPKLGEKLGRGEKVNSLLKNFNKNNPQMTVLSAKEEKEVEEETNQKVTTGQVTPVNRPAEKERLRKEKRRQKIKKTLDGMRPNEALDLDADAFSDPDFIEQFDHDRLGGEIMNKGSEKLIEAYILAYLKNKLGLTDQHLNIDAAPAGERGSLEGQLQAAMQNNTGNLLDGSLSRNVFKHLRQDQQAEALTLGKVRVKDLNGGEDFAARPDLSSAVASSGNQKLIDETKKYHRQGFEIGLDQFIQQNGAVRQPTVAEINDKVRVLHTEVATGKTDPSIEIENLMNSTGQVQPQAEAMWYAQEGERRARQSLISKDVAQAQSVRSALQPNSTEAERVLGYNSAQNGGRGDWIGPPEQARAQVAQMASTESIISALKGLRLEAIVTKDPATGSINGLSALGNVIAQNIHVSTLMRFAQEAQTKALRDMTAALVAGKKLKGTDAKEFTKKEKAPAFSQVDWEPLVDSIKGSISS